MAILRTYKDGVLVSEDVVEDAPPEAPAEDDETET
jgi:hypothetical protein